MQKLSFKIETITPLFLEGADGRTSELRPPTIKGMMRFWWRAYKFPLIGGSNEEDKLSKLLEQEGRIFGSSSDGGRKSSFSIKITTENNVVGKRDKFPSHPVEVKTSKKDKPFKINILEYLAYGTYDYIKDKGNQFVKDYIDVGNKFCIEIMINGKEYWDEILSAMYFLLAFGGLGGRSRNGFGGIAVLNKSEIFDKNSNSRVIPPTSRSLEPFSKCDQIPPFSSFSGKARLFQSKNTFDKWNNCLAELATIYKECRSNLEPKHRYTKRQYIASPVVVNKQYVSMLERRAKPYFLKVLKDETGKFRWQILYLPSKYCAGLEKDMRGNNINEANVDSEFLKICSEFNGHLMKIASINEVV